MDSVEELLSRQSRVLARHQVVPDAMTKHAWTWKLERGLWQRVLPGIAVAHSGELTVEQRRRAAVLHGGPGAALSGREALAALGMRLGRSARDGDDLDVVVPPASRPRNAPFELGKGAVRVHRVTQLPHWSTARGGLALMRAEVAVLHAFAWADPGHDAEWLLAAAVQQRRTTVPLVRRALGEMPRLSRRALAREVLDDVELGAHAGSELRFLRFLRTRGLPLPDSLQRKVRFGTTHYLDARYTRLRLTVEVDGAHHREVRTWEDDAMRTLRVVAHQPGERVVRITTGMLRNRCDELAALLRLVLV